MAKSSSLATSAVYAALRTRHRAGVALTDPASPIDIAERIGVSVSFMRTPSMEGMFVRAPHPQIILSSLRPPGRINFTCAHELGHHWFGHAAHVDATSEDEPLLLANASDEYQANAFASSLLMPKTAVQHGFVSRGVDAQGASPRQFLAIAHWLGVGYTTLVHHAYRNLGIIDAEVAPQLLRQTPREIVQGELDKPLTGAVVVVDRAWRGSAIDLQVGDVAIVDGDLESSGECVQLRPLGSARTAVEAVRPGTGHLDGGAGWSAYVRVRRFQFEGRSIFRHLEEEADGDG